MIIDLHDFVIVILYCNYYQTLFAMNTQKTAKKNLNKRMEKFDCIIRQHPKLADFKIKQTDIIKMIDGSCNDILFWNGVEIESCKQQKTSYKSYKITATNWFNRNKAKIFGNHFFFPMIWKYLLNVC